ncbi:chemotaxis protein CheW [Vibrio sonorensis]|uniref:chemotaxis protein CheW n=1 Tax=Vibrio sonorensis TaxID=1004316 RepID=UPI0008D91713|nr:chemotaxis protein CheW [Vibrio sonorensis]
MASNIEADEKKFLEFKVADKYYAYPISSIREIMEFPNIESLSGAPDSVLGIMNLRGRLVIVLDLSCCLGHEYCPVGSKTCVIVTEVHHKGDSFVVANKVDLVRQVIDISSGDLEPVPELGGVMESPLIRGLAKLPDRLLTILDTDKLLSEQQWKWLFTEQKKLEEAENGD